MKSTLDGIHSGEKIMNAKMEQKLFKMNHREKKNYKNRASVRTTSSTLMCIIVITERETGKEFEQQCLRIFQIR